MVHDSSDTHRKKAAALFCASSLSSIPGIFSSGARPLILHLVRLDSRCAQSPLSSASPLAKAPSSICRRCTAVDSSSRKLVWYGCPTSKRAKSLDVKPPQQERRVMPFETLWIFSTFVSCSALLPISVQQACLSKSSPDKLMQASFTAALTEVCSLGLPHRTTPPPSILLEKSITAAKFQNFKF